MNGLFFHANDFSGNLNLAIFVNLLIYVALLLTVPSLIILALAFIKPKLSKYQNLYLYAFSAATLICIGTIGLFSEGIEKANELVHLSQFSSLSTVSFNAVKIGIILGGALLGLIFVIGFRYLYIRYTKQDHCSHSHDHGFHITNTEEQVEHTQDLRSKLKGAWLVIILLLSHRTIDGFIIGGAVAQFSSTPERVNVGFIIIFNIHIILEVVIIHYRQVQYGQTVKKAALSNFLITLILIPIMFIGAYIYNTLDALGWFIPIVNASGGAILTFMAVIEIVPEFIHNKQMPVKNWYFVLIAFAIGILVAVVLLSFHSHGHDHSHAGEDHAHDEAHRAIMHSFINHQIPRMRMIFHH